MSTIRTLQLHNSPITDQLRLEEALFRTSSENWCLVNSGAPPAIVLGTSCNTQEVLAPTLQPFPIVRRFSGGGTVIIDENTLFFTLILNRSALPCPPYPQEIMTWTNNLLAPAFLPQNVSVQGNDYVIGNHKIGGIAQSFSKDRIVHHVSFLWDWAPNRMNLLCIPQRQPDYRAGRSHENFCGKLSEYFHNQDTLLTAWINEVHKHFTGCSCSLQDISPIVHIPHRKSVHVVQVSNSA
jgi:lipoate-protein ligase A